MGVSRGRSGLCAHVLAREVGKGSGMDGKGKKGTGGSFSPSQSCFAHRASSLASSQAPLAIAVEMSFSVCAATAYLRGGKAGNHDIQVSGGDEH